MLLEQLRRLQISEDVGYLTLAQIKRSKALLKLSEAAFKVKQGLETEETLQNIWKEMGNGYDQTQADSPLLSVSTDLEHLLGEIQRNPGVRWGLNCLNKSLGSLRKGDFGFIFARPETGKTTFLASEVTSFLSQPTSKVVWFNNEEQGYKVMLRAYQAFFDVTLEQLMVNPKKYNQLFQETVGNRFILIDSAILNKNDVEKTIDKLEPTIVIYDQLPKITGFSADRKDLELGAIFQWARELAKDSHAAIGVSQADGSAEGIRYLTMEHVANVKTAVQAEADWILGIGKAHDPGQEYVRYFNISKNKLIGDNDSIPELRHGRFEVLIEPQKAKYKDVIKYE